MKFTEKIPKWKCSNSKVFYLSSVLFLKFHVYNFVIFIRAVLLESTCEGLQYVRAPFTTICNSYYSQCAIIWIDVSRAFLELFQASIRKGNFWTAPLPRGSKNFRLIIFEKIVVKLLWSKIAVVLVVILLLLSFCCSTYNDRSTETLDASKTWYQSSR